MLEMADVLITEAQRFAKENPEYIRLYHQITATGSPSGKTSSAELIESGTARLYEGFIKSASEKGAIRRDIDPSSQGCQGQDAEHGTFQKGASP